MCAATVCSRGNAGSASEQVCFGGIPERHVAAGTLRESPVPAIRARGRTRPAVSRSLWFVRVRPAGPRSRDGSDGSSRQSPEAAIPPGHRGFLDAYLWPGDDLAHEPDAKSQLLRLLPAAAQSSLSSNEVLALWPKDEDDEDDHEVAIVRLTVPLELRRLDYRALFRLIAHDELGLEPRIGARVYLVDETDPLVF
jgi:hypothetical protein